MLFRGHISTERCFFCRPVQPRRRNPFPPSRGSFRCLPTCLPLTTSQPAQGSESNHHHGPSALCCTPEEATEERGTLAILNPLCWLSFTQPVSGLFQTSSALTLLSHTRAKSLCQLQSTLFKSLPGETETEARKRCDRVCHKVAAGGDFQASGGRALGFGKC